MIVSTWLSKFWGISKKWYLFAVSRSKPIQGSGQPLIALDNFYGLLCSYTFIISFLLFVVYASLVFIYPYSVPWSSCLPFSVYS